MDVSDSWAARFFLPWCSFAKKRKIRSTFVPSKKLSPLSSGLDLNITKFHFCLDFLCYFPDFSRQHLQFTGFLLIYQTSHCFWVSLMCVVCSQQPGLSTQTSITQWNSHPLSMSTLFVGHFPNETGFKCVWLDMLCDMCPCLFSASHKICPLYGAQCRLDKMLVVLLGQTFCLLITLKDTQFFLLAHSETFSTFIWSLKPQSIVHVRLFVCTDI